MSAGLYDIDKTIIKKNTFVPTGIHENLELTEVVYKPTETSEFLAFYFVDENGNTLSHTEWPTKKSKAITEMNDDEKDQYFSFVRRQRELVHQILAAILETDEFPLRGNTFKEFAESAIQALANKSKGKKVRAKVVYDYRGFTSLANNPSYRFIEPMSVSKENSEIELLESDNLTRKATRNERRNNAASIIDTSISEASKGTKDEKDQVPF